jgi:hypothetical protein
MAKKEMRKLEKKSKKSKQVKTAHCTTQTYLEPKSGEIIDFQGKKD